MSISIFSAENCAGCKVVKSILESNNIPFEVKDIMDSDVMEEAYALGIRAIPVTAFYGKGGELPIDIVCGSSNDAVALILEIAKEYK